VAVAAAAVVVAAVVVVVAAAVVAAAVEEVVVVVDFLHNPLIKGKRSKQPAGAVLIVVIIAILLVAALGAALYTLSSSSKYGNVSANLSTRAFYVAESGYRYAVSEYRQYKDENKDEEMADIITRMEEIHDNARALPNGFGTFTVFNRPYFFITTSDANSGDTYLSVRTPGEFPSDFIIPDDVWIFIDGASDLTQTGNNIQTDPDSITFELNNPLADDLPAGTIVYLAAIVSDVDGDTLTLDSDVTDIFPEEYGQIEVMETIYTYEICERQGNDTDLSGIDGLDAGISSGDYVLLRPMVQLDITGEIAGGETGGVFGKTRDLSYLVPVTDEILTSGIGGGGGGGRGGGGGGGRGGGGRGGGGGGGRGG